MLEHWGIVFGLIAALSIAGVAVVAWLPTRLSSRVLPGAPVIGAAALTVLLHLTSLVLPVGSATPLIIIVVIGLLVGAFFTGRLTALVRRARWQDVVWGGAVVVIGAVLASLPSLSVGWTGLAQTSYNHDGFYFVAAADWLQEHTFFDRPAVGDNPAEGAVSPAFGPAMEMAALNLRVGQDLLQAMTSTLFGVAPVDVFSPALAVWVALLASSSFVAARLVGLGKVAAATVSLLAVTSLSLLDQVLAHNAASLLGIALVPLGLASLIHATRNRLGALAPAELALPAVTLAALAGTYPEHFAVLGGILVMIVLIGRRRLLVRRIVRGAAVVVLALVLAPAAWVRASQSALALGQVSAGGSNPPLDVRGVLDGALGPLRSSIAWPNPQIAFAVVDLLLVVAIAAIAAGIASSLVRRTTRGLALGLLLYTIPFVAALGLLGNPYSYYRSIDLITPVIIFTAGVGLAFLIRRANPGALRRTAVVAALALAVGWAGINVNVIRETLVLNNWDSRVVTDDFAEVAEWTSDLPDPDGSEVSVATVSLFEQLWVSEALRDASDVSYLWLRGDLGYRWNAELNDYWSGEVDRYQIIGAGVAVSVDDPDAVLHQNSRFSLLDLSQGDVVFAVPGGDPARWSYDQNASGKFEAACGSELRIVTNRDSLDGVTLTLNTSSDSGATSVARGLGSSAQADAVNHVHIDLSAVPLTRGVAAVEVPDGECKYEVESIDG